MYSLAFNDFNHSEQSTESAASSKLSLALTEKPACCSSRCIASINLLELEQIQSSFCSRSRSDQRQFLFDIVIASAKRSNCDTFSIDEYVLSGKTLCQRAFISVLRISHKRLRTVTRLAMAGAITAKHTLRRTRRKTDLILTGHSSTSPQAVRLRDCRRVLGSVNVYARHCSRLKEQWTLL